MAEQTIAEQKLVQYLSEAYGKEKELETALQAHLETNTRRPYKKRLQQHLRETKNHSKLVERRIKKISGSGPGLVAKATGQPVGQLKSLAKGPLHMARGTGGEEKLLKNAKTEYWNEHEEIATYTAIETLAERVGDKETAKVAKQIRREEERMADFLAKQIPILTRAVAQAEIPASERKSSSARRRSTRKASTRKASTRKASARKAPTRKASTRKASARKASTRKAPTRKASRAGSASKRSASSRSSGASTKRTGSSSRSSTSSRSTASRRSSSRSGGSRGGASSRSASRRRAR